MREVGRGTWDVGRETWDVRRGTWNVRGERWDVGLVVGLKDRTFNPDSPEVGIGYWLLKPPCGSALAKPQHLVCQDEVTT